MDKEKADRFYRDFCDAINLLKTSVEVREFFSDFLTRSERIMLSKRFQVMMMLINGHDYESVKEKVEVSNSTVTRVSDWLKAGTASLFKIAKQFEDLRRPKYIKKTTRRRRGGYMAGNLLSPAIEEGASFIAGQIAKRRQKSSSR